MIEKAILSYALEKQWMLLKEQHVLIMISVAFPQTAHQLLRRVLKKKNAGCMLGKNLSYHNDARRPKRNVMHIFVRDNNSWHISIFGNLARVECICIYFLGKYRIMLSY